jgi:tetratricopeptide (TPR) repeat protein
MERAKKQHYVTRLREMIDYYGLSAEGIAGEFGVSGRCMQYYVSGQRPVPQDLRPRLAGFFRVNEDFLFPPYTSIMNECISHKEISNDMKRRDVLAWGMTLPLALSSSSQIADTTLRLAHALAHPGRLDESAVKSLEEVTRHAWLLDPGFSRAASEDAVLYIEKQLAGVVSLLSEAPGTYHQRLYTVAGELCMISAWLLRDLGKPDQAMVRHLQALQSAAMAENYALAADIKSRIALLLIHHEGPHAAEPHVRDATSYAALADGQLTERRRGWIAAIAAEVYGGVGDEKATKTALETGEEGLQSHDPSDYYTTAYSTPVFSGFKAMALLRLSRYDDARTEFQQSLENQAMSTYRRSHKTADLAILEIAAGNTELAAQLTSQAVELATEVNSPILNKHLVKVHRRLLPNLRTCEAVKQLDVQMREYGIIAARR